MQHLDRLIEKVGFQQSIAEFDSVSGIVREALDFDAEDLDLAGVDLLQYLDPLLQQLFFRKLVRFVGLHRSGARYLPVMKEGRLLGVISFRDVAKAVLEEQDFENRMLKGYIKNSLV